MISVQGGYWISRILLGWPGTRAIIRLDPKGLAKFATGLQAPDQFSDLEAAVVTGGSIAGLDFLIDDDFGILTAVGLAISALSGLFSPSLDEIKRQTVAELKEHITTHLKLVVTHSVDPLRG